MAEAGVSKLLASLSHTGRRRAVLGHTLDIQTLMKTDEQKKMCGAACRLQAAGWTPLATEGRKTILSTFCRKSHVHYVRNTGEAQNTKSRCQFCVCPETCTWQYSKPMHTACA